MVECQLPKLEPDAASPETTDTYKPDNPDPRNTPSNSAENTPPDDAALRALIDAWPLLPEPVKDTITRLAQLTEGGAR